APSQQPLRHLMLIHWLFVDWPDFWSTYQQANSSRLAINALKGTFTNTINKTNGIARLSVEKAPQAKGVDVAALGENVRTELILGLRAGLEKWVLAERHSVNQKQINSLLWYETGLSQQWKRARHESRRTVSRAEWLCALGNMSDQSIEKLKIEKSATYLWLSKWDKAWLDQTNRAHLDLRNSIASDQEWAQIDLRLSDAIRSFLSNAVEFNQSRKVTRQAIFRKVPSLRQYVPFLSRLPLTLEAIRINELSVKNMCPQLELDLRRD
ncbi:MAG: TnsD family Tn7-like transposition protein, partial [Burkholderiales bacterium]